MTKHVQSFTTTRHGPAVIWVGAPQWSFCPVVPSVLSSADGRHRSLTVGTQVSRTSFNRDFNVDRDLPRTGTSDNSRRVPAYRTQCRHATMPPVSVSGRVLRVKLVQYKCEKLLQQRFWAWVKTVGYHCSAQNYEKMYSNVLPAASEVERLVVNKCTEVKHYLATVIWPPNYLRCFSALW